MINVPLIDGQLGFRLAVHGSFHEGYERNIYSELNSTIPGIAPDIFAKAAPGPAEKRGNSLGTLAGRASLRWQPNDDTTIDLVADVGMENDRRVRGDKQECHYDPAG